MTAVSIPPKGNPHTLEGLPDELLILVLEALVRAGDTKRHLWAMCLVSRRINSVADPVLYRSILFDEPEHHLAFSASLATRPRRGSLIQDVRLEYPGSKLSGLMSLQDSLNRIDTFSHTISTMSNLENLVISVPDSLCHGIGTLFNGPFDLACLKSCSLFYQCEDDGYWDLRENIHIFGHPTLEHLTIRRARLDRRGFESPEQPSETALKELNLYECDINDEALSDLLLFPEALKSFTMTQREEPVPALEESSDDVEDYILALHSAQHSLESITIDFAALGAENALRLRDFQVLSSLRLRDYQLFGQSSNSPRLYSVGLPSTLEVLEFVNPLGQDDVVTELLGNTIEQKDILARKWRKMIALGKLEELPARILEACDAVENFTLEMR
ncbi:hypothetical protein PVAG01_11203 [Phlyctema vagabunda]|uniref:F-box domain-containing protein n=1 Tax=Phlyctema vagabunda TaxID=108571 RepID=A0ABR4P1M8_9HELO